MGDMIEVIIAMTFLYFSYTTMMPGVSYIKATDVFLGACFLFVFLAFVKLAVHKMRTTKYVRRVSKRTGPNLDALMMKNHCDKTNFNSAVDNEKTSEATTTAGLLTKDENGPGRCFGRTETKALKNKIFNSKLRSILIFPIAFVIFCAGYFIVYLAIVKDRSKRRCVF